MTTKDFKVMADMLATFFATKQGQAMDGDARMRLVMGFMQTFAKSNPKFDKSRWLDYLIEQTSEKLGV